jgi:heat shock protein HslJ
MRSMLAAALALPILIGCAQPSQSASGGTDSAGAPAPAPGGAAQVTVELTQGQGAPSGGEDQKATAESAAGGAVVRGTMSTPTPCHRLTGAADQSGSTVTLRVSAAADPDAMCIQSIGSIPYTATLRGLPAGSYTLRVVHTYPGTGWETATALETQITAR